MTLRTVIYMGTVVLIIGMVCCNLWAQNTQPADAEFYHIHIDKIIQNCECKIALRDAESEAIQRAAALALLKSTFLKSYKDQLIEEMQSDNIGFKAHQVEYYLNRRFFDIVD